MAYRVHLSVERPECKGEGHYVYERHAQVCGTIEDDETRAHFCHANCQREDVTCRVCGGNGFVSALQAATYRARGGAAPVQRRGFA
jgi:hypothetical protein